MAGVSKVILIGNLGRDPETRYTPNGTMNVKFTMAVSRRWNDQSGQQQERTTWFSVTGWGKLAETMDRLTQSGALVKGKQVFVSGSLETSEWQDQNGKDRTTLEVRAEEMQLLGSRADAEGAAPRPAGGRGEPTESFSSDFDDVPF